MNGQFIFEDSSLARAPPLEAVLKKLPIIAQPSLTLAAEQQAHRGNRALNETFENRLYFGVREDLDAPASEYFVTPIKTHYIDGVLNYKPSPSRPVDLEILSAWDDLLEVGFHLDGRSYVFNLCFHSYHDPASTNS
jgi:hypothetical protein